MSATPSPSQRLVIGRYELYDELASGGMARVFLGRLKGAVGFSRMVAVKRLHAHLVRDRQFVTMFVDEARLAARIRHPNVVPIIDVVRTEDELFLVMELIQGASLARAASLSRKSGAFVPIQVAVSIVAGVLHGLHAAHEAKDDQGQPLHIVHRDVSPHNVIIGIDGVPRVLDFGIAKAKGRLQNTAEGVMKGKLGYMAPEQIGGTDVGREADLYAAAVILWELLAGRRLFKAATETLVLASVLRGAQDPPSAFRPEIPEALDELCMKALSPDPAARFATARELAQALEAAAPIASAGRIAAWLEEVADELLQNSAIVVASADSQPRTSAPDLPLTLEAMMPPVPSSRPAPGSQPGSSSRPIAGAPWTSPPIERTALSFAPPEPRPASRTARLASLAVAALLAAACTVAALRWKRQAHEETARTATAAPAMESSSAATSAPAASASAAPVAAAREGSTASPAASASSLAPRPPSAPRSGAGARRPATPPSAADPAPAPPPARKADCDPPYTLDNRGIQRLKPQCL